jgi:hypothetical protein
VRRRSGIARLRRGQLAAWQRALLALILFAFGSGTYLTQTHIHFTPELQAALAEVKHPNDKEAKPNLAGTFHHGGIPDKPRQDPSNDDPANCPLCQEYLYAGNFVAPAAIDVLPPTLAVSAIAPDTTAIPHTWAISHNWQGRAPPSA